jgi:hypothetical protein
VSAADGDIPVPGPDHLGENSPARAHTVAGQRRAAGIYGTIVTAAVIAAGGAALTTLALEVTVLVTLIVYWLSEQYAELLGEHIRDGRLPSLAAMRTSLANSWPMVTASFVPLVSLVIVRLVGGSTQVAADVALGVTVVLLVLHGSAAGKAAGLSGTRLVAVTIVAGLLGAAMILLKVFVRVHH